MKKPQKKKKIFHWSFYQFETKKHTLLFYSHKDVWTQATEYNNVFIWVVGYRMILQISNITYKQGLKLQACEVQIEVGRFSSKFCSFQGNHFLHKYPLRGDIAVGSSQPWNTHAHKLRCPLMKSCTHTHTPNFVSFFKELRWAVLTLRTGDLAKI